MNWRTVDVPKRSRNSMRRIAHALVLTILILSSGCLGLLGDDDSESVVKESIPIELSMILTFGPKKCEVIVVHSWHTTVEL